MDTIKAWYSQNLQLAIPISIAVGIAVLLFLLVFVRAAMRCCRGSRNAAIKARDLRYHERIPSYEPGYVPPPTKNTPLTPSSGYNRVPATDDAASNRSFPNRTGWVDNTAYNGRW
jgi:hypothetical protein